MIVCSFCLCILARGKSHSCTKSMRVTNIKELAETGSSKCIEKVTSLKAVRTVVFSKENMSSIQTDLSLSNTDFEISGLNDLFTLSNEEYTMKEHFLEMAENNTKLKLFIICNDINQLICLNLININDMEVANVRQSYSDGITSKQKKDSSVNKLFVLGMVPAIPENFENVLSIWQKLEIEKLELPYTISTDLKLANIITGLMGTHSFYKPCCRKSNNA
ncbi:hypothetical protein A3Q56_08375 [Intoshia linei]|uniref:Uncharacterized protein n=1 Tax=Intoshia linei TaxID=1819745 RepID=A0A177API3_9BILA|nr:hypothetical protein A3Q56_08375 [Intoshia linei]